MTSPVRDPPTMSNPIGGCDDHLVLDDGGTWKIDAVRLTVWRRGNEEIMGLARQRSAS